jgi:hypothetical protein
VPGSLKKLVVGHAGGSSTGPEKGYSRRKAYGGKIRTSRPRSIPVILRPTLGLSLLNRSVLQRRGSKPQPQAPPGSRHELPLRLAFDARSAPRRALPPPTIPVVMSAGHARPSTANSVGRSQSLPRPAKESPCHPSQGRVQACILDCLHLGAPPYPPQSRPAVRETVAATVAKLLDADENSAGKLGL